MHDLRITRAHLSTVQFCLFILCAVGIWVLFAGQGENGFDALPLFWYLVLTLVPLVSLGCFIAMWSVRFGSRNWLALGGMLTAPQLIVWYYAMRGVLHYLGAVSRPW